MELNGGNVCFAASAAAAGRATESDVTGYGAYTPPKPPRRGGGRPQGVTPLIFRVFFNPRTIKPFVCKVGRCNYHHSYKQLNTAPLWHFLL